MNHRGYSDQQKNSKKVLWALIVMLFCFVALPVILIISIRDAEALRCHHGTDPVAIDLCHAEWEREWQEHARQHEQWEHERREHERQRERERKQDQERKEVERKRKEEERRKEQERRDEEERQRLALFWTVPFPAEHCHSYGTREYTAHLQNLPMFYSNRMKACMSTSASLHDVTITPNFCVDHVRSFVCYSQPIISNTVQGFWGGVSGHFKVNFSEPTCTPSWGDFSINVSIKL